MSFPQPEFIDVNGVTLEVFTAGHRDGGAGPIVLCHGWPEHAYSWRHQIPVLVEAGYHVIVPNQRGYGSSSRPEAVTDYDIHHLCGDLVGLLDHFGYRDAVFVGHDWGAIVVWNLAMLHPDRVRAVINLSVPFLERGPKDWVSFWEERLGGDFYIVHFNRQPGVADRVFERNTDNFLRNLYRTDQWQDAPVNLGPGMALINLATAPEMPGRLMMSEAELAVFVDSFRHSGFTGGINWYRNFTRNWETTADVRQRVDQPVLMIHGAYDMVPANPNLAQFAPNAEVHTLPCGHWIQQEQPAATNQLMLDWLRRLRTT
jgi:pimeloyl-ACP methyl ester carboxylesterase